MLIPKSYCTIGTSKIDSCSTIEERQHRTIATHSEGWVFSSANLAMTTTVRLRRAYCRQVSPLQEVNVAVRRRCSDPNVTFFWSRHNSNAFVSMRDDVTASDASRSPDKADPRVFPLSAERKRFARVYSIRLLANCNGFLCVEFACWFHVKSRR
tara:strand:- start:145 stop:606 length:462 start_codon:yes stop_codon:yes gene_type:complete